MSNFTFSVNGTHRLTASPGMSIPVQENDIIGWLVVQYIDIVTFQTDFFVDDYFKTSLHL